jgi:hypothetical protein
LPGCKSVIDEHSEKGSTVVTLEAKAFHQRALEKIGTLRAVSGARQLIAVEGSGVWGDTVRDGDTRPRAQRPGASFRFVSEDYFQTMGIALLKGAF